jgi:hypothetical protein
MEEGIIHAFTLVFKVVFRRTTRREMLMRMVSFVFALVLAASGLAFAQDWSEYQNIQDGFKIDFPAQPKITETTWTSEYGYKLPARVYSAERGKERYSMTVVDYNPIEPQGIERRKNCPAGAEPCIGSDLSGPGYWKHDIRGAIVYATSKFLERDVKMTRMLWAHQDLIEGIELQLTSNVDQSRTFAFISMRENKLYIAEGTVPKGYPQPGLFQQSMGYLDKDGNGVRYQKIYSNEVYGLGDAPAPSYGRGGAGAAGGGRQGGGGGRRGGGAGNTQQEP